MKDSCMPHAVVAMHECLLVHVFCSAGTGGGSCCTAPSQKLTCGWSTLTMN